MALFRPTLYKEKLIDLTLADLRALGVDTLLLDVDNTLSTHHSQTPLPGVEAWLMSVRQAGITPLIVSNSRRARVEPFARRLNLPFACLCKKPLPFGVNRVLKARGIEKKRALLCGDQLFTDMPAGHLIGVKTLLVTPAEPERPWHFRLRRALERPLRRRYERKERTV